jgi:hypothetical protein
VEVRGFWTQGELWRQGYFEPGGGGAWRSEVLSTRGPAEVRGVPDPEEVVEGKVIHNVPNRRL